MNTIEYLHNQARMQPDSLAIAAPSLAKGKIAEYTYLGLKELIDRFAVFLSEKITKGDKVVMLVPLSAELYCAILASISLGAVPVLYEPKEIGYQLRNTLRILNPDVVITTPLINIFLSGINAFKKIKKKIFLSEKTISMINFVQKKDFTPVSVSENSPAIITFTSGSEGIPKGIYRTHRFLDIQFKTLQKYLKLDSSHVIFTTLPVFVLQMLAAGSTVIIPETKNNLPWRPYPEKSISLIRKYNVNMLMGAPAFLNGFIRYSFDKGIRLDSVKTAYVGGGFLENKLIYQLEKVISKEGEIKIIYGSTEAEPICVCSPKNIEGFGEKYGFLGYSVGKPVEGAEVKIIALKKGNITDSEMKELFHGEIGELVVSGIHVNDMYIPKEPAFGRNKIIGKEGKLWHRMGDAAYIDEHGNIWLAGRFKHLPDKILNNFWNYLRLISEIKKADIADNIAFVEDKNNPQKSNLFIEAKRGIIFNSLVNSLRFEKTIKRLCRKYSLIPDRILFRKEIPKDRRHNSKIDYGRLKGKISGKL